jgi:LPXTG-site transpeptidase (sortase) family protein
MDTLQKIINAIATILIIVSIVGIFYIFGPVVQNEIKYGFKRGFTSFVPNQKFSDAVRRDLIPPDSEFSIVIPKIEAVAPVISSVDPFTKERYLAALKNGVAHARGTAFPNQTGNTYIFAHSTDAFYNVGRYNAIFYLIGKLEEGDDVYIYYKDSEYKYKVYDKKIVSANDIKYLGKLEGKENTLTLQTCYPPGTTLKRLVVLAERV